MTDDLGRLLRRFGLGRRLAMRPVHIAALACLLSCAATPAASAAAIEKLPPSVPAFDDDFVLQGEYVGSIKSTTGTSERIGLQVVARGNGQFQALEYAGGLPGNGGAMENRRKYSGAKSSGAVELAGDDRRISIERDWASVRDASGRELGRLAKHHRLSQTLLAPPPREATVLFRGTHADRFTAGIVTADKLLNVGADTVQDYGDFSMHLEFRTPYMPAARGQARGNSGVYIQGRYELQILDSFGLDGLNNECGGIYTQQRPLINMCLPPLSWQTYDIDFIAAKFDAGGKKISPARITARHNGIVIHDDYEISSKTGQGAPEGPDPRPIKLQDHGNPVHFRNIWVVERKTASGPLPSLRMTPASGPAAPCLPGLAQGATFDLSVRSTDPFALSSRAGR